MIYKYLNHAQCTTRTMVPTLLGREIMCQKSRFCSTVADIEPNADVPFRVWRSDPQKAGPLAAGELPQQRPM